MNAQSCTQTLATPTTKVCKQCLEEKPIEHFYKRSFGYRRTKCNVCLRAVWGKNAKNTAKRYSPGGDFGKLRREWLFKLGRVCFNCGWYKAIDLVIQWKNPELFFLDLNKKRSIFKLQPEDLQFLKLRCNREVCAGKDRPCNANLAKLYFAEMDKVLAAKGIIP